MGEIREQVALVTGASGGIGRAIAVALAARGMRPCLSGRNLERLQQTATATGASGARATVIQADLSEDEGISALAASVEALRRLDVLVHGAGALCLGDALQADCGDLDELYRVNLRARYLLTMSLLPPLVASRGQIVFLISSAALRSGANNALYAATKSALASLAGGIRDLVTDIMVRPMTRPSNTRGSR